MTPVEKKLQVGRPRRILALDGGGIRGSMALGYLAKIEKILLERHPHIPDFRLCDYFDLIGGTSTGAIIAGALSIGMSVEQIQLAYHLMGKEIFSNPKGFLSLILAREKFKSSKLKNCLREVFGDTTFGDDRLRTGLAIFARRVDEHKLYAFNNNPQFIHYKELKNIRIRDAIQASAAVPSIFKPVDIDAGELFSSGKSAFVDGGFGMAGSPALWLLLMTRLPRYGLRWPVGKDRLLMVSVGTGRINGFNGNGRIHRVKRIRWATWIPQMMLADAKSYTEMMMQILSQTATPRDFGSILGSLEAHEMMQEPLLQYLRYDYTLEKEEIEKIKPGWGHRAESLQNFTNATNTENLFRLGSIAAEKQVDKAHFPPSFDVSVKPARPDRCSATTNSLQDSTARLLYRIKEHQELFTK